jgi:hypothetical protein
MSGRACQIHEDGLPGRGETNKHGIRSGLACRRVSGSIEADLVTAIVETTEIDWAQTQIAPGF